MTVSVPAAAIFGPVSSDSAATAMYPLPSPRYAQCAEPSVMSAAVVVGPPEPAEVPAVIQR